MKSKAFRKTVNIFASLSYGFLQSSWVFQLTAIFQEIEIIHYTTPKSNHFPHNKMQFRVFLPVSFRESQIYVHRTGWKKSRKYFVKLIWIGERCRQFHKSFVKKHASSLKKFPSNHLFSKNVIFTKFLPKSEWGE